MRQQVIQNIKKDIVADAIIQAEHINYSKSEYKDLELEFISAYGYDEIDEFISDCGEDYLESEVNKEIVKDFLYENAVIKK